MTIDDGHRRSRSTSRDIERYAALFAERTKVMKSSAMRDLMALTERDDVISLAGGLPDTSTFPPDSYAALMRQVATESCARALQYAPTEGLEVVKRCILDVMGAEGMHGIDVDEILVTTGGQQVIDLVCKTLIDPGDVIVAEAPTYPGAVPTFCAYQADVVQVEMDRDGMRVDQMEATLDRLEEEGRRPKFIYTVPTFQNPAGVTMSLPRRERLVRIAQERELLVLEDNPYGLLRYEGEPVPTLRALDGGEFVIYLGTFSKILSPGIRLGWAVAPRPVLAKMNIGKQAADLCSSSMTQHFVAAYFDSGHWQEYVRSLARDLPPPARHHARRARRAPASGGRVDPPLGRAVRVGHAARLHRHDRPARPRPPGARRLRPGPGGVPRRPRRLLDAPQLLGGRRGRHPRGRATRRQGRARAGRPVRHAHRSGACQPGDPGPGAPRCRARRRARAAGAAARPPPGRVSRVAVLKGGRSLEREVSLRSGARVEDALQRLGHDVVSIDVGGDLVARLRDSRPDVAFVALHGRDGEDGTVQEILELLDVPYTGSGVSACIRCMDKVLAKHAMRDAGIPTPDFYAFNETAFKELGAGGALPEIEERLEFPIVVKPAAQGSALGIKFARSAADVPAALVAAFSYDTKVLLERHVEGRDLAVSVVDLEDGPTALPVVEAVPQEEDFYDFEARYEIGRSEFVCPADIAEATAGEAQRLALDVYRLLGCVGFARVDLMLDREAESSPSWRPTRSPG